MARNVAVPSATLRSRRRSPIEGILGLGFGLCGVRLLHQRGLVLFNLEQDICRNRGDQQGVVFGGFLK